MARKLVRIDEERCDGCGRVFLERVCHGNHPGRPPIYCCKHGRFALAGEFLNERLESGSVYRGAGQKASVADQQLPPFNLDPNALSGHRIELLGIRQSDAPGYRALYDGLGQRVLGGPLGRCH